MLTAKQFYGAIDEELQDERACVCIRFITVGVKYHDFCKISIFLNIPITVFRPGKLHLLISWIFQVVHHSGVVLHFVSFKLIFQIWLKHSNLS